MSDPLDVVVVGAGAAGLAAAVFAARQNPALRIAILDGAAKVGAKILVSGGGRCNVTHEAVAAADFWGGSPNVIRRILAAFPVDRTITFFKEIGVTLHVEDRGKLFPDSNSAHTVLDAFLAEARRLNVDLRSSHRVSAVVRRDDVFHISSSGGGLTAHKLVLATGGLSLPKTGSDGGGYKLAASLGHSLVTTTPGLEPLILDGDFHTGLSGIAQPAVLAVRAEGRKPVLLEGPMLWTHFGISGPAALDASRHWQRATLEGVAVKVTANFLPGNDFAAAEAALLQLAQSQPRTHLRNTLASLIPSKVAEVKDYLDIREINGYSIQYTPFHPAKSDSTPTSTSINCLVYIGLPDNPQFMGPQDLQKLAEHILRSKGPSGQNREYLYMLEEALNGLSEGSRDGHVSDLAQRCRALEAEGGWEVETGSKLRGDGGEALHRVVGTKAEEEVEKVL